MFTRSVIKPTIWTVTREINLKIFEDDVGWYEEMKARGLVKRSKGKIVPTEQWTSATSDPVYSLITRWVSESKIQTGAKGRVDEGKIGWADLIQAEEVDTGRQDQR